MYYYSTHKKTQKLLDNLSDVLQQRLQHADINNDQYAQIIQELQQLDSNYNLIKKIGVKPKDFEKYKQKNIDTIFMLHKRSTNHRAWNQDIQTKQKRDKNIHTMIQTGYKDYSKVRSLFPKMDDIQYQTVYFTNVALLKKISPSNNKTLFMFQVPIRNHVNFDDTFDLFVQQYASLIKTFVDIAKTQVHEDYDIQLCIVQQ